MINYYYTEININQTPWVIVGGALGLLLVFRTNTAYDRYWEGRKLFGAIGACTRNLAISFCVIGILKGRVWSRKKINFTSINCISKVSERTLERGKRFI